MKLKVGEEFIRSHVFVGTKSSMKRLYLALLIGTASAQAHAHVKWFASWDIVCPPRDPMRVLTSPLWQFYFAACVATMAVLAALDSHLSLSRSVLHSLRDRVHEATIEHAMLVLRVGLAIYWVLAAFTLPNAVYLTPELLAPPWVSWFQAACAALVLSRRTSWLSGFGMIVLYSLAIIEDGWFHLLDYPVFLAIGFILIIANRGSESNDALSMHVLRWSAALTLLWGAIEKFAYPEWSFPLMRGLPTLSLGASPEAAMHTVLQKQRSRSDCCFLDLEARFPL